MSFHFEFEGFDKIEKRFEDMHERLQEFGNKDIGDELFNWEAEDLHRKQPWVRQRHRRAQTIIRPHSIKEMKASHKAVVRAHRRHHEWRHWSTRPILRPELLQTLWQRMTELMQAKLKW